MSIDVNVTNDLVVVTESSEDITVNVSNAPGPAGVGVPIGGTAGQVLKKLSNTNYDTFWTLDGVGVPYTGATGDVNLGAFNLTATSIIKSGGTSSQFLKADGSVDSSTYQPLLTNPVTGTGATGQVAYWDGTSSQTGSNNLFWDAANERLGIGTNAPAYKLHSVGNAFINGSIFFGDASHYIDTNNSTFCMISSNRNLQLARSGTASLTITSNFNTVLQAGGTITDGGQRLQVQGDAFIKGSGATSATIGLQVQDSGGANMLRLLNDTTLKIGSQNVDIFPTANGSSVSNAGRGLIISTGAGSQGTGALKVVGTSLDASGNNWSLWLSHTFGASSGTATHSGLLLNQTINQTGGANGITRGLYVNPTLTAAADWRSIEWSNNSGWGLYGAGTAANLLNGNLGIGGSDTVFNQKLYINGNIRIQDGGGVGNTNSTTSEWVKFNSASGLLFGTGGSLRASITAAGRLLLGTTTESTFLLDVNGTARVSGSVTISTGTTSQGTLIGAGSETRYSSNSGLNTNSVYLSGTSSSSDGIIQFLSGGATSNIVLYTSAGGFIGTRAGAKFGAIDGSDTVSIVTNTWIKIGAGTTARSQINLTSSTAPTSPNDGDIWFDGTDLKMRIGGVTKTFTLL